MRKCLPPRTYIMRENNKYNLNNKHINNILLTPLRKVNQKGKEGKEELCQPEKSEKSCLGD